MIPDLTRISLVFKKVVNSIEEIALRWGHSNNIGDYERYSHNRGTCVKGELVSWGNSNIDGTYTMG